MPSIEEKAIFRQINYIKNKFKGVREETENVVSLLHDCLEIFDCRIRQLEGCEVEQFTSLYRKLKNDFEEFHEKLIYTQASIELHSDSGVVPKKPAVGNWRTAVQIRTAEGRKLDRQRFFSSTESESDLQNKKGNEVSSCHTNSESAAALTPSSSCNSSYIFPTENVTTSVKLDNIAESVASPKLTSYPSVNDLGNAEACISSATFEDNDQSKLPENAASQAMHTKNALSGTSSRCSNDTFAASSQNKTNAINMYPYSSNSTSFASVNDIEDSEVNYPPAALKFNKTQLPNNSSSKRSVNQDVTSDTYRSEQLSSCITSVESLSQTSYHHSVSSNLSDYQSACSGQDSAINNHRNSSNTQYGSENGASQTLLKKRVISPIQIDCPITTTATITHIENPGNFWMRLDNFEASRLSFPKEMFLKSDAPSAVEVDDFFLAPSKSVPFYLRVKVVTANTKDDTVKVFCIDHGSTQNVSRNELRILPFESYNIPMQSINCFLADISAPNGIWCYAAIQKLKEFSANSMKTYIKWQVDGKYAVQLIATVLDFTADIGHSLKIDGFAIEETPLQITDRRSVPDLCDNTPNNSLQTSNQLSTDSGVSITYNQPSTSLAQAHSSGSVTAHTSQFQNDLQELCSEKLVFQATAPESNTENKVVDLISFESSELIQNDSCPVSEGEEDMTFSKHNKCLKIGTCKCPLHLLIPFPSIKFVEQDMVLVMISHITHPNKFYVNMAMESSTTYDELLEQMFNAYNSQVTHDSYSILLDDLREGMFCAAGFDDGNWYRVKVLKINRNFDQSRNVLVHSVDYGNDNWVQNTDLRTLTPTFAKHPAFSVKCSLVGIVPAEPTASSNVDTAFWNKKAVNVFKSLVSLENCLTAEICDRTTILSEDPLQILLWDTQGENDVLLNKAFVETGLAKFDYVAIENLLLQRNKKKPDVKVLNSWDPMNDEYNDVLNSYGVNFDDIQVATDGYKPRDEEYICKYYSLRGYCPRKVCPYEHVPLAEGGVTRDKDELYSFNCHPPLPKDGSSVLIQVSAVISPSFFYAQLPFGNLTVDELDSLINQGKSRESLQSQEINELYGALNEHYTNKPFDETTTIALSYGTIVVARRQYDQTWHRARIIDVQDITGPAKVFYVDFGNEEWVDRKNIRQILPQFLHAPFQAVECCLYDVEPLGFEKGQKWSSYAVSCFKDLVSETIMLAHVAYKFNDTLQVSLRRTTQTDHFTVREHLIREGFGQEKLLIKTKKPASKYIPG